MASVAKINLKAKMLRKLSAAATKNMVFFKLNSAGAAKKAAPFFFILDNAFAHSPKPLLIPSENPTS
jgi:hypothetical protein